MDKLTIAQAAETFHVAPSTLHSAITKGHLPAERVGRKMWLISPADVGVWMASGHHKPERAPRDHWRKRTPTPAPVAAG